MVLKIETHDVRQIRSQNSKLISYPHICGKPKNKIIITQIYNPKFKKGYLSIKTILMGRLQKLE
jgi:hypothetical protein